jgi:soluble lytic murein transglycosylase-like protein
MFVASLGGMNIKTKMKTAALAGAAALATVTTAGAAAPEAVTLQHASLSNDAKSAIAGVVVPKPEPKKPEAKKPEAPAIPQPDNGTIEGVSVATLESIAACESGGDPTAVNAAGYYGKYQFDESTWASVGGSGNPAEASEAEQDYRAALLYSRAGSSPWPVCGS